MALTEDGIALAHVWQVPDVGAFGQQWLLVD